MQKLIYICAPLRGDVENNIEKAKEYSKKVIAAGHIPICTHVMFAGVLDDEKPDERKTALEAGLKLVEACDEIWQFGEASEGMSGELELADKIEIPVRVIEKEENHASN